MIDSQVLERHGLKADEYDRIVRILGREPNVTELGIFSVMWSEHCSYKSSRVHLKTLPTTGRQVLQGPGENAGAVDIGDGLAAVFKIIAGHFLLAFDRFSESFLHPAVGINRTWLPDIAPFFSERP